MPPVEATPAPPDSDLFIGGSAVDLDHVASMLHSMAFDGRPAALEAMPSAMGSAPPGGGIAGPSRPIMPSTGTNHAESAPLPGSDQHPDMTTAILGGYDPSLVSLDLVPLQSIGRDVPLAGQSMPRAPGLSNEKAAKQFAPAAAREHGPQDDPHSGYYFLSPQTPAAVQQPRAEAPLHAKGGMIRDDFPILRQKVNGHRLVWLDSAATTQKPESVITREAEFYRRDNSNVHRGAHTLAKRATDAYENARATVQRFLGAGSPQEIVFVRGTTEGVNLIAQSLGRQTVGEGDEIIVSHLEHHSNIVPWQMLCREKKAVLRVIPVDDRGDVRLDVLQTMIGPRTRIVSVTHVSNVLGTLVPIAPIAAMAHRFGAAMVVDGAQAAAHVPVDVTCLDADFYLISGHKLYAPTGIGAVYAKKAFLESMPPWQGGGSMIESVSFEHTTYAPPPAKFEAGTGHFAGAVGLAAAIEYLEALGRQNIAAHEQQLVHYAMEGLSQVPGLRLLGAPAVRIGALSFVIEGREPTEIAQSLDKRGIAVRAGHHCAQPILNRFGLETSVRASLGVYSAHDDIDALVAALREA